MQIFTAVLVEAWDLMLMQEHNLGSSKYLSIVQVQDANSPKPFIGVDGVDVRLQTRCGKDSQIYGID